MRGRYQYYYHLIYLIISALKHTVDILPTLMIIQIIIIILVKIKIINIQMQKKSLIQKKKNKVISYYITQNSHLSNLIGYLNGNLIEILIFILFIAFSRAYQGRHLIL